MNKLLSKMKNGVLIIVETITAKDALILLKLYGLLKIQGKWVTKLFTHGDILEGLKKSIEGLITIGIHVFIM